LFLIESIWIHFPFYLHFIDNYIIGTTFCNIIYTIIVNIFIIITIMIIIIIIICYYAWNEQRLSSIYRVSNSFHDCFQIIFILNFKSELNQNNSKFAAKTKDFHIIYRVVCIPNFEKIRPRNNVFHCQTPCGTHNTYL